MTAENKSRIITVAKKVFEIVAFCSFENGSSLFTILPFICFWPNFGLNQKWQIWKNNFKCFCCPFQRIQFSLKFLLTKMHVTQPTGLTVLRFDQSLCAYFAQPMKQHTKSIDFYYACGQQKIRWTWFLPPSLSLCFNRFQLCLKLAGSHLRQFRLQRGHWIETETDTVEQFSNNL